MKTFLEAAFERMIEGTWQASVLILLVLFLQRLFRNRLTPQWQYALWIPVVIRLLLPSVPSSSVSLFGAPAFLASRMGTGKPQVKIETNLLVGNKPAAPETATTLESAPGLELPSQPHPVQPRNWLTLRSAAFLWATVSALLFLRMAVGVVRFALNARRGARVDDPVLLREADEAKARLHCRGRFRVLETDAVASPALFGLIRPALLLPKGLRAQLSKTEFQHVLAHEIAHLKRGDLPWAWVLALAQTLHWFNPLVWYALGRCRADRELACDALALSRLPENEYKNYGATILKLIEVFPSAPRATGVIGILEGKHQMKRRIEFVARFRNERRMPWCAIALIALLTTAGLSKPLAEAEVTSKTKSSEIVAPRSNPPLGENKFTVRFTGQTLDSVLMELSRQIARQQPTRTNVFALQRRVRVGSGKVFSANAVGYINYPPDAPKGFGNEITISTPELKNASLTEVLTAIRDGANRKISWHSSEDKKEQIVFTLDEEDEQTVVLHLVNDVPSQPDTPSSTRNGDPFFTRTFQVSPRDFIASLRSVLGKPLPDPTASERAGNAIPKEENAALQEVVRAFFLKAGADFPTNATDVSDQPKKAIFFNPKTGVLFVRANLKDLGVVESALHTINITRPQVTLDTCIAEISRGDTNSSGLNWFLGSTLIVTEGSKPKEKAENGEGKGTFPSSPKQNDPSLESQPKQGVGILTEAQFQQVFKALKNRPGTELLAAPKVTTLSGRTARVSVEPGPTFEFLPKVEANGASVTVSTDFKLGDQGTEPVQATLTGTVWDGQTLVFWLERNAEKRLMVFVTPTIIDPAGNRVHPADPLPKVTTGKAEH